MTTETVSAGELAESTADAVKALRWFRNFVALSMLDVHSTYLAVRAGAGELNPILEYTGSWWYVGAAKLASIIAVGIITSKLSREGRGKEARYGLIVICVAYLAIVVNNYANYAFLVGAP